MPHLIIRLSSGAERRFPLDKERVSVGRSHDNDIFLADSLLSRHHAEVVRRADAFYLSDLRSKNGTHHNGTRVEDEVLLQPGDLIALGEHCMAFEDLPSHSDDSEDTGSTGDRELSATDISDALNRRSDDQAELRRQNQLLGILTRAAQELVVHRPLDELFELVLDLLFEAVPAERATIMLVEPGSDQPAARHSRSRSGDQIVEISSTIAQRVISERVSLLLQGIDEDAQLARQESLSGSGIRCALCAPLWFRALESGDDQVIGLVYLDSRTSSQAFDDQDLKLVAALANLAAARIETARLVEESLEKRMLDEDMARAAQIQTSLLPSQGPELPGYDVVGTNQPCRAVGGDYFDFGLIGNRLLLALGDVSGKGTAAALLMTVLRASVRGQWADPRLADAVSRMNGIVCENVPEAKFMTCFVASLEPESGRLVYVNAGHNPPLLVRRDGGSEPLREGGGMVMGLRPSASYEAGTAQLAPGDTLLVFSDGVTETWNDDGEEFGERRLGELAARRSSLSAAALQDEILAELARYSDDAKATDDRTLIVLKREWRDR